MKDIRIISAEQIEEATCQLFLQANRELPLDVEEALKCAKDAESDPLAKDVLGCICQNLVLAKERSLPICQDTGMAVVFVELGNRVIVEGDLLTNAIERGVIRAYQQGAFRASIVKDPLYTRENTGDNAPALVHVELVEGDFIRITALPKGFGSENTAQLKMFPPSASENDILSFIVDVVKSAGGRACPPVIVGVGLGSDFEGVALLAKRALCQPIQAKNPDPKYAAFEKRILEKLGATGIGPQGMGGDTTALAVHILAAPTHIASLPCAVNINCHVARHASVTI